MTAQRAGGVDQFVAVDVLVGRAEIVEDVVRPLPLGAPARFGRVGGELRRVQIADRERRARIINADAELQASKKLAEAAQQMSGTPAALQLRLLQTVMAVSAEKNSTLVLPIPVELLHFLERGNRPDTPPTEGTARQTPEQPPKEITPEETTPNGDRTQAPDLNGAPGPEIGRHHLTPNPGGGSRSD